MTTKPFKGISIPLPSSTLVKRRYSVTQDIVSFRRCARQYGFFNVYKYALIKHRFTLVRYFTKF